MVELMTVQQASQLREFFTFVVTSAHDPSWSDPQCSYQGFLPGPIDLNKGIKNSMV
jgi:hypothetical protein